MQEKNQKTLKELEPSKPIPGGGFPKIGKPTPYKKKYANAYKKKG